VFLRVCSFKTFIFLYRRKNNIYSSQHRNTMWGKRLAVGIAALAMGASSDTLELSIDKTIVVAKIHNPIWKPDGLYTGTYELLPNDSVIIRGKGTSPLIRWLTAKDYCVHGTLNAPAAHRFRNDSATLHVEVPIAGESGSYQVQVATPVQATGFYDGLADTMRAVVVRNDTTFTFRANITDCKTSSPYGK
jgi:hypothetical protein